MPTANGLLKRFEIPEFLEARGFQNLQTDARQFEPAVLQRRPAGRGQMVQVLPVRPGQGAGVGRGPF
jgi:hypothetical protein